MISEIAHRYFPKVVMAVCVMLLCLVFAFQTLSQGKSAASKESIASIVVAEKVYFDAASKEVIQPGVLAADKVSGNSIGNVLTLLFDSASLSLQTDTDPLSGGWIGTIRIPINPVAKAPNSYLQHLRGAVKKTKDARVSIIVTLGGKTFITEFPYGKKHDGNVFRSFVSPVQPSARSYTATIVILVERSDAKSAVLVNVDGLDVEAKAKGKTRRR